MKYKLRCLLLCFLFIFSLQGCQKETKLEKPGNLITTTKNSLKENPNTEDPVETVPITGGITADINSSTGDESNSEIAEKDGTVDNSNIHIVNSELKKIPESIMEQFQKNGWHIYVTDADINQKFYQGKYSRRSRNCSNVKQKRINGSMNGFWYFQELGLPAWNP